MFNKILIILLIFLPTMIKNEGIKIINTNNKIVNSTRFHGIEYNINKAIFHLNIEGLVISIHEIPKDLLFIENGLINGFVIQKDECNYFLFISPLLDDDYLIEVLAHEVIHINQYYTKKLVYINSEKVIWKDSLIKINEVNYSERPWEVEAFNNQDYLSEVMKENHIIHVAFLE